MRPVTHPQQPASCLDPGYTPSHSGMRRAHHACISYSLLLINSEITQGHDTDSEYCYATPPQDGRSPGAVARWSISRLLPVLGRVRPGECNRPD